MIACSWLFPEVDEVMVNVDGSRGENSEDCGAIIRDHHGKTAAACGGVVLLPSLLMNYMGLK